jgi:DNA polymerase III subunit epsilon
MRRIRAKPNPGQLRLWDDTWRVGSARSVVSSWTESELLCFDLETTGVDRFHDAPVSFALITLSGGQVVHERTCLVDPGCEIPEASTAVHGITTGKARRSGMPLDAAIDEIVRALVDASRSAVPVVGVKLDFDLTMVDVLSRRFGHGGLASDGWIGPVLDGLVLDRHLDPYRVGHRRLADLCKQYGVRLKRAHDASADALAAGGVILAMASRFPTLRESTLIDLHDRQVHVHREWASSHDRWRRGRGLEPLDAMEWQWPLAGAPTFSAGAA